MTPDNRDADPFAATSTIKKTAAFIGQFFRGVSTTPSIIEPCMYTVSLIVLLLLLLIHVILCIEFS